MLDNKHTLDWQEILPAMMLCYNTHVQRATQESTFFLTFYYYYYYKAPSFEAREAHWY